MAALFGVYRAFEHSFVRSVYIQLNASAGACDTKVSLSVFREKTEGRPATLGWQARLVVTGRANSLGRRLFIATVWREEGARERKSASL